MPGSLFEDRRDFVLIYCSPSGQSKLVERYRDPEHLLRSIPNGGRIESHPVSPFVGGISFPDLAQTIRRAVQERNARLVQRLCGYLEHKTSQLSAD